MNIRLHIDRLVLDGVALSARERPRLQAAVEAELGRLLGERGLAGELVNGGAVNSIKGSAVQLSAGGGGTGLGTKVAQAVYGGIGK